MAKRKRIEHRNEPKANVAVLPPVAIKEPPFICRGCRQTFPEEGDFRDHIVASGHTSFYFRRHFGKRIAV